MSAGDGQYLGPFDDVVVRAAHVVAGPLRAERVIAFRGSDGRWLDAERTTETPHVPYSHFLLHSREQDLIVRFFAEDNDEASPATNLEIGPYSEVSVGPWDLRGDGVLLADRPSPSGPWLALHASVSKRQAFAGAVVTVRPAFVAPAAPTEKSPDVVARSAPAIASPTPSFGTGFKFVERVRVEPKIYRARGTAAERDP